MALISINAGAASVQMPIWVGDSSSTTGAGLTGLTNASAGLTAYYHRSNATSATAISLVSMTLGTWTSGGFLQTSLANQPGLYVLCLPDAAVAAGARFVTVLLKGATNMVQAQTIIQLDQSEYIARQPVDATYPASSVGKRLSQLLDPDGTAVGGAATTITLAAAAASVDDYYNHLLIAIATGTGAGQVRLIDDYVGATKVATVSEPWVVNPDGTSGYVIVPAGELNRTVESQGGYSAAQVLSICLSALAGTSPSSGVFKTPNDAATRIAGTVNSTGVRSAITLTPST